MGAYLVAANAFVILAFLGYLLLNNPELLSLLRPGPQPPEPSAPASTSDSEDDSVPEYSYSTHKIIHPGCTTAVPFPFPPRFVRRTVKPTILHPIDATSHR